MVCFRFVIANTPRKGKTIIIIVIKNNNMLYQITSLDSSRETKKGWKWVGHFGITR